MPMRIAMLLCVLIGVSGCLDAHEQSPDLTSDNLNLQKEKDAGTAKPPWPSNAGSGANCGPISTPPPSPPQSDVDACYAKAKDCYAWSAETEQCDAVLKYCSTLPAAQKPEPKACRLKVQKCQTSADGTADCVEVEVDCQRTLSPEIDACLQKAKACLEENGQDPKVCDAYSIDCGASSVPTQPDPANLIEACWLNYKQCFADGTDPAKCDSLIGPCQALEAAGPQ